MVAMADGYAQAACRPGFVNLHTAGGLGHGLGSLLNASVSGTPLVVTAGQQDSRHTITDRFLFGDLVGIARPAVKWAQKVQPADQLPILVRRAFHDCSAHPAALLAGCRPHLTERLPEPERAPRFREGRLGDRNLRRRCQTATLQIEQQITATIVSSRACHR